MEVLELKSLKDKKICLYLIRRICKDFFESEYENLRELIKGEEFRFALVDFNDKESKSYYQIPLLEFLNKYHIPYYNVDIPEHVKNYLYVDILNTELQVKELESEYESLIFNNQEDTFKAENLKSWIDLLNSELMYKKRHLESTVKPMWIFKKILDIINDVKNEKLSILHFTNEELYSELKKLFEEHQIKVIKYNLNKKNIHTIII